MNGGNLIKATIGPACFGLAREADDAGHVRTPEQTWAQIEPLLERVPVTRIYELASIDYLGLPVWSAVTPLAQDLTVHSGKGTTSQAARVSAAMEAIERVSGENTPPGLTRRASYRALADREGAGAVVDPALWSLPFDTTYDPDTPTSWVLAHDLVDGGDRWVARDLVVSPATEGVCSGAETNGLASGNTILEATLHGLVELIERDASALEDFYDHNHDPLSDSRPLRIVDPASLPDAPRHWLQRLTDRGLIVALQEITSDIGIPVFTATIADTDFPGGDGEITYFEGSGADEDPERAALRAITEVVQAHSLVMLGARDSFEGLTDRQRAATIARQAADRCCGAPTVQWTTPRLPPPPRDLAAGLKRVIECLTARGFAHCLVADLTRADLAIPVVRVLVPGLVAPYGDTTRQPAPRLFETLA